MPKPFPNWEPFNAHAEIKRLRAINATLIDALIRLANTARTSLRATDDSELQIAIKGADVIIAHLTA